VRVIEERSERERRIGSEGREGSGVLRKGGGERGVKAKVTNDNQWEGSHGGVGDRKGGVGMKKMRRESGSVCLP